MTDEIKALNLESDSKMLVAPKPKKKMLLMVLILIFLGVSSGYGLYLWKKPKTIKRLATQVEGVLTTGDTFGVVDEEAFKDEASGIMTAGGIDDEGSHHLVREGGESKYVYLTSSIIDLDQFIGKEVKIWGETFKAQKAGWLMDVGRLEIL